ncbi:MAG: hypothetical protein JNJ46_22075 [Myxococcales bacterium]|nr:hypothetical protein [Myxococcales bacterium]
MRPRCVASWALLACVVGLMACGKGSAPALSDPDPGLADLTLLDVGPRTITPGTPITLSGRGFPSAGDGTISLRLRGSIKAPSGGTSKFDVRLRAVRKSATSAQVAADGDFFAALGGFDGTIDAQAVLMVDSAIDLTTHVVEPLRVNLEVARVLAPRLDSVELAAAMASSSAKDRVHPNDWVIVRGDNLLLDPSEGQTTAVLDGCFLPEGQTGTCVATGTLVRGVEVLVRPVSPLDRRVGIFPWSPVIHGIRPGRFVGTVGLKNQQRSVRGPARSDPRVLSVAQVPPELVSLSPNAAGLGQYIELLGAGFIGGSTRFVPDPSASPAGPPTSTGAASPGQVTILRLRGQFTLDGSPIVLPVELDVVVEWLPRFPSGPVGRYVLDETDAMGQALAPRGGLRQVSGTFSGSASLALRYGKESVPSKSTNLTLRLLRPKQLVLLTFLPSYQESLRLFGLRAIDRAVRARVLDVARRDYSGLAVEFREVEPEHAPPEDFAHYAEVEIGGSDPNGLGYLGYDNTPGRDLGNARLYDRIGGVNAVTQSDGSPGYGGVFSEQLLGFSAHPGRVEKIKIPAQDAELFDSIFDPLRPDQGGEVAALAEVAGIPALSNGSICPALANDRARVIACAVLVLGNLIGTTMTHELGHSLGLANPSSKSGSYHNNGQVMGRIMNPGGLRSFRERAELAGSGPAVFCDSDFAYLQKILPDRDESPGRPQRQRPPCLD